MRGRGETVLTKAVGTMTLTARVEPPDNPGLRWLLRSQAVNAFGPTSHAGLDGADAVGTAGWPSLA